MRHMILATFATLGVVVSAQAPTVLDLTQKDLRPGMGTAATVFVPVTGASSHAVREQLPLDVVLTWMDRSDYHEYDPFTFRVVLHNRGRAPVVLPWEPNRERVITSSDTPLMQWLLAVGLEGGQFDRLTIPVATLYGSTLSSGSLQTIDPGKSVEIVASGQWKFLTPDAIRRAEATLPGMVNVRAHVAFLTGINGHVYQDLASTNHVSVALDLPQPR